MISNADMADVPELQDVRFARGASRDYHLDTKGDYTCRWKSPKGKYLSGESVTLDEDGAYILELTNAEEVNELLDPDAYAEALENDDH